ncbi:MAG: S1 RNA-binding domain-containing protein [Patescibacteria group bacterium]
MSNIKEEEKQKFEELLEKDSLKVPQTGDIIKGKVISASKSEVRVDINGVMAGVVRGPQMFEESDEYANLKPGDEVEATVVEEDNEDGEVELSFRDAGEKKAWEDLMDAYNNGKNVFVRITEANKGGLMVKYAHVDGFLPVSQLAPENYPRVSGGDKGKILEKLRSFVGTDFEVKVINVNNDDGSVIFSEKEVWSEKQKHIIDQYQVGTVVEGVVTAVTNFGVFISFGDNNKMEGLIHISELDWKRIDNPSRLYQPGDTVKAEIIALEDAKIFLSAKKLKKNPWENVNEKYNIGDKVKGRVLKVNPFGLFVQLDEDIHGLAHVSQLGLDKGEKIEEKFQADTDYTFEITSLVPQEHRLGLRYAGKAEDMEKKESKKTENEVKEEQPATEEDSKTKESEDSKKEQEKPAKKTKQKIGTAKTKTEKKAAKSSTKKKSEPEEPAAPASKKKEDPVE